MPLSNVNLMGPNPAQPFDLQTQQAQLAQAAAIAQALIAGSMEQQSPVVHTGGGNPFARDVVNLGGPIGALSKAYFGGGMLKETQAAQQDVAQKLMEQYQREMTGVTGALFPHEVSTGPTEQGMGTRTVPGDPASAIAQALASRDPRVQAIGAGLMKNVIDAQQKMLMTPEAVSGLARNLTPPSIAESQQKGLLGFPILSNVGALQQKPVVQEQGVGARTAIINPNVPTAPGVNTGAPNIPPTQPITSVGGSDVTRTLTGEPVVLPTAASKASQEQAEAASKSLDTNYTKLQAAKLEIPNLVQVAQLMKRAQFGITSDVRMGVLRLAQDLGVKLDANELGSIQATQTAIARMLPLAALTSREFNSRAAQQLIETAQEASGANPHVDPNHVIDVTGAYVADIMSKVNQHNLQDIPNAEKTALGANARAKLVPFSLNDLPKDVPWEFKEGPMPGQVINAGITTPRGPAFHMTTKTVGGKTYVQTAPGQWSLQIGE